MIVFTERAQEALKNARNTYGSKNQIVVSIEECNELSAILAKFVRYHDEETAIKELGTKVLDEVADVTVILEHVKAVFGLSDYKVGERIEQKISRLERWLKTSSDMEQTTIDREVQLEKDEKQ